MVKKTGIALAFCVLINTVSVYAFTEVELEKFRQFTAVHMTEVTLWEGKAPANTKNIFYMAAEPKEWAQIEAMLDLYFTGLTPANHTERLAQLQLILSLYGVTIKTSNPIGVYHIGRDEVYVDFSLFKPGANRHYAASIVFHEKVHQNQNRTLDKEILRIDQRQKYAEKLEEIAAHYQQIKYVIQMGDPEAIELALKNSNRWNMFPGILRTYPPSDIVVHTIREFQTSRNYVTSN